MSLHSMSWDYYTLKDGWIVDDEGRRVFSNQPRQFADPDEAEEWLAEVDERGTVTGLWEARGTERVDPETRYYRNAQTYNERHASAYDQDAIDEDPEY